MNGTSQMGALRACVNCGRSHRPSRVCCMECRYSVGVEHSRVCDITWDMQRAAAALPPEKHPL